MLNSIRVMTSAYLFYGDSVLLMQRSPRKKFMPNVWAAVGGHVEPGEHGDLLQSCLREIAEETGIQPSQLNGFSLRYVLLRQRNKELRQQFVYFGTTTTADIGSTDEGTLHWIPYHEVFNRRMTDSNRLMLEHYFGNTDDKQIWVGTLQGVNGGAVVRWAPMSDWG